MIEYIYFLIDPKTKNVKYVGKSKNPKSRYKQHINNLDKLMTPKRMWLEALFEKKILPEIVVIEKCEGNGREREQFYIDQHKNTVLNIHNPAKGAKSFEGKFPKRIKTGDKI